MLSKCTICRALNPIYSSKNLQPRTYMREFLSRKRPNTFCPLSFTTNILSPLRRDHRKERGEKNCGTLSILSSGYPYSLILSEQFPFGRFTSPLRQMAAPSLSLSHPNTLGSRIQYLRSCLQVQGIFLPGSSNNYVLRPIPIHCAYRINRV